MAVLKQRKIDGERRVFRDKLTDQYYFKAQKRNSCVFSLLGKNIEYSFSGSSREGHEVPIITLTTSRPLNASANQLDIVQFAANRNWLGIGHRAYCRLWSCSCCHNVLVATSDLDANVSALGPGDIYYSCYIHWHCTWHVSVTHFCPENPTFVLSFIYMFGIIWPSARLKSCYLARNLK